MSWKPLECFDLVIALVSLFISISALCVACQANKLTDSNQKKIERMECVDKFDSYYPDFILEYESTIVLATQVNNYREKGGIFQKEHTLFLKKSGKLNRLVKQLNKIGPRLELSCPEQFLEKLNFAERLSSNQSAVSLSFSSNLQDKHRENLKNLDEADPSTECCFK